MSVDRKKPKNYRRAWNGEDAAKHLKDDWTITVCAACSRATCWQGEFYCEDYRTAGTKEITIAEARRLNRENPTYWLKDDLVMQQLAAHPGGNHACD